MKPFMLAAEKLLQVRSVSARYRKKMYEDSPNLSALNFSSYVWLALREAPMRTLSNKPTSSFVS